MFQKLHNLQNLTLFDVIHNNTRKDFWYIKNPSITKLDNFKNSLSQLYNAHAYLNNGNLTASNHLNFLKMQYIVYDLYNQFWPS